MTIHLRGCIFTQKIIIQSQKQYFLYNHFLKLHQILTNFCDSLSIVLNIHSDRLNNQATFYLNFLLKNNIDK